MKSYLRTLSLYTVLCACGSIGMAHSRSEILLDDKWHFSLTPDSASALQPLTATVNLPHDWSVGLPFDRNGTPVPDADTRLTFSVSGPATILASGSADLKSPEPYQTLGEQTTTRHTTTWKGRAIIALKSSCRPGKIRFKASSATLPAASIRLNSR